ncbi:MAG TPA: phosphohydrolase [Firmicutes bacterium]|nr:phosphohydrolase [Bacillota bacterium]
MKIEALREKLANTLSPTRFQHSLRVMGFARELARHYHIAEEPVVIAALLHDVAREVRGPEVLDLAETYHLPVLPVERRAPVLLHGRVGAEVLKREWAITDESILKAVAMHVTGAPKMDPIAELTLIADFAEPNRPFFAAEVARKLAFTNRQTVLRYIFTQKIRYILDAGFLLHPLTIEARNHLMEESGGEKE